MSIEKMEADAITMLDRGEAERAANSAQEITLDGSNKVAFPGFPYKFEAIGEKILVSIDIFKSGYECKICLGKKTIEVKEGREGKQVICPACKGLGAVLIIPETSKNLPTTGIVVSMGIKARAEAPFKIGDRILFGPYAGNMIPTKAGLMFKILDYTQAWAIIEGADELGAFDFILQDSETV